MKRLIKLTILLLIMFITGNVYAASVSLSATSKTVYVGDSASFKVTVVAGAWNLTVSGASSDMIVGYDEDKNATTVKTYAIDTSRVGTYTLNISGDITDYDTELNSPIAKTFTVNVIERPVTQTQQVTTTTTQTKTTKVYTTNIPATPTQPVEETTTTEPITTQAEVKGDEEIVFDIKRFEVVGYELDFDKDQYEYTIKVDRNVSKLYIIVEGTEIEIAGDKEVDIKDKDQITVIIKKDDVVKNYVIKLDKSNELDYYIKSNKGLKICILVLSITLLGFGAFMLYMFKFRK